MRSSFMKRSSWVPLVAAGAVLACSELSPQNGLSDTSVPVVRLAVASSSADSILSFTANVTDNLGIKRVHIESSGGVTGVAPVSWRGTGLEFKPPVTPMWSSHVRR